MKPGDSIQRVLAVYDILKQETDAEHILSMPQIIEALESRGMSCDRRTVYDAIHALQDNDYKIRYVRKGGQGYYLEHEFTTGEVLFLADAVQNSPSLSPRESRRLSGKVSSLLSYSQMEDLPLMPSAPAKTDNDDVLTNMELIQKAIRSSHAISFRYFDMTLQKTRAYRRNSRAYELVPYAILSNNGRYYCVCYSPHYKNFTNYRIDRMSDLLIMEEPVDRVPFDQEAWIRTSFNMYSGKADTVTCDFASGMSSQLFDQFGEKVIVTSVEKDHFRASISTAVTPTLIAWLLQYYDQLTVLSPQSLKDELLKIADTLQKMYGGK